MKSVRKKSQEVEGVLERRHKSSSRANKSHAKIMKKKFQCVNNEQ
jgi:hypothetical protein